MLCKSDTLSERCWKLKTKKNVRDYKNFDRKMSLESILMKKLFAHGTVQIKVWLQTALTHTLGFNFIMRLNQSNWLHLVMCTTHEILVYIIHILLDDWAIFWIDTYWCRRSMKIRIESTLLTESKFSPSSKQISYSKLSHLKIRLLRSIFGWLFICIR